MTDGICMQGLWEGNLAGTSVRGPENQEGVCESLKGHIALAIGVLFWFLLLLEYIQLFFSLFSDVKFTETSEFWLLIITHIYIVVLLDLKSSILREVSACPRGTKAVLFRLANFSWII